MPKDSARIPAFSRIAFMHHVWSPKRSQPSQSSSVISGVTALIILLPSVTRHGVFSSYGQNGACGMHGGPGRELTACGIRYSHFIPCNGKGAGEGTDTGSSGAGAGSGSGSAAGSSDSCAGSSSDASASSAAGGDRGFSGPFGEPGGFPTILRLTKLIANIWGLKPPVDVRMGSLHCCWLQSLSGCQPCRYTSSVVPVTMKRLLRRSMMLISRSTLWCWVQLS
mmetsp:Transcript_10077/g.26059  ORF Transcript_10077/g.26059 Transcript_10077/m.26059 type:complete len:223 (+) Transcript_10077:336-1004(+)